MDTPDVGDLYEKFKPKRYEDLDVSGEGPSPSKWRAGSEPSFAATQFATQDLPESQGSGIKRKADEIEDFALRGVSTPDTPYGAFLGKNPSKSTRKFFKKQCEDLEKFGVPELQQKRQKLDESYVNPDDIVKQEKKERPGLLLSLSICCTLQLLQQPPSHCGRIQIFVQKFNFHGISCNFEF